MMTHSTHCTSTSINTSLQNLCLKVHTVYTMAAATQVLAQMFISEQSIELYPVPMTLERNVLAVPSVSPLIIKPLKLGVATDYLTFDP